MLRIDTNGDIVHLVLDRKETKNALDRAMVVEIHAALARLAADPPAALIVRGANDVFASGADIAELKARTATDARAQINARLFTALERFPAPTIAAVNGYALGGGCELALACDLRVAGHSAVFGQPEVALGIIPAAGAAYRLARIVGLGRAKEMIFTGRRVLAEEALAIGLCNRVVADGDVVAAAEALAAQIAAHSREAVRRAKQSIAAAFPPTETLMAVDAVAQAVLFEHPEKHTRMQAFLERKMK